MKKLCLFLLLPFMMLACQSNNTENQDTNATQDEAASLPEHLSSLVLDVHGMTCKGCEQSVAKSLMALPGVYWVEASHVDSLALVQFDPGQASVEEIQNAVNQIGYEVVGFRFQDEEVNEEEDTVQTE